jgi:hypothetical protein
MPAEFRSSDAEQFADAYRQHAATLRNWFVAYGVGGPALLITNDKLQLALRNYGRLELVGWCFLGGVFLQVVLSFTDKYADWLCYRACVNEGSIPDPKKRNSLETVAFWWVTSNWPSILIELVSVLAFAVATGTAFRAMLV